MVHELAGFERPSASEGERRAAEWIAARMAQFGHRATVEVERAHGGYWWPLGLLNGAAALAGLAARRSRSRRARLLIAALCAGAAAAIWDEVGGGRLWFRRAVAAPSRHLQRPRRGRRPRRRGDRRGRGPSRRRPQRARLPPVAAAAVRRATAARCTSAPTRPCRSCMRRGSARSWWRSARSWRVRACCAPDRSLAAGAAATMADIASSEVVPGANDNLSAVAVLVALGALAGRATRHGRARAAALDRL